jgi:hypothetical protein
MVGKVGALPVALNSPSRNSSQASSTSAKNQAPRATRRPIRNPLTHELSIPGAHLTLLAIFQREQLLEAQLEQPGQPERQYHGRLGLATLDSVDRLPADAHGLGQFFLA